MKLFRMFQIVGVLLRRRRMLIRKIPELSGTSTATLDDSDDYSIRD